MTLFDVTKNKRAGTHFFKSHDIPYLFYVCVCVLRLDVISVLCDLLCERKWRFVLSTTLSSLAVVYKRRGAKETKRKRKNIKTKMMVSVQRKMDNVTPVIVALVALNLIGSSWASPLPQRSNHSSLALIALTTSSHRPPHSSESDPRSLPTSESSTNAESTLSADQLDRVQLLTSSWEPGQFNLPFSVSNSFFFFIFPRHV